MYDIVQNDNEYSYGHGLGFMTPWDMCWLIVSIDTTGN